MTWVTQRGSRPNRVELITLAIITLLAIFLRGWRLDSIPPGWRDDELINSLVISQKVIDGEWAVYYADASGHEALYHALNAGMLAAFGPGVPGIRWLSAALGTLSVVLTWLVGRRLLGPLAGLIAAAALAFSFWSLMYSRIGLRHILTPVLALAVFYFFLRGLGFGGSDLSNRRGRFVDFTLAAVFIGLGFYTYFAGRGVPLILLAFCLYLILFARERIKKTWPGLVFMFGLAALSAVPLLITLANQPESEARVAELAVPLVEARQGNFEPLGRHVAVTLNMFLTDGDDEWLYNIPNRPVFGPTSALFFWAGVLLALGYALYPLSRLFKRGTAGTSRNSQSAPELSLAAAFLIFWWLAGISPAFISVPPASLGHTILAQPAVFILAALPVWWAADRWFQDRLAVPIVLGLILLTSIAVRDLPAYFSEWPQRGMTRFLYRADIHAVAGYLNENPELEDFGITSLLAGPWDKIALTIDLDEGREQTARPRWYNPERVLLLEPAVSFAGFPAIEVAFDEYRQRLPGAEGIGGYRLYQTAAGPFVTDSGDNMICFTNGLCWVSAVYDRGSPALDMVWRVNEPLQLPEIPLISNPPPPGVYSGPRLHVFAQMLDSQGTFLDGDDGLWVDPLTLHAGDLFVQRHYLDLPEEVQNITAVFGLYDPKTGERILTTSGQDHITMEIGE